MGLDVGRMLSCVDEARLVRLAPAFDPDRHTGHRIRARGHRARRAPTGRVDGGGELLAAAKIHALTTLGLLDGRV